MGIAEGTSTTPLDGPQATRNNFNPTAKSTPRVQRAELCCQAWLGEHEEKMEIFAWELFSFSFYFQGLLAMLFVTSLQSLCTAFIFSP